MEQSHHMIPRVFSLMWMVSHPGSLAKQFIHTISGIFLMQVVLKSWVNLLFVVGGVPSWSLAEQFLSVNEDGVPSWLLVEQFKHSSRNLLLMRMVSHPGHGTRSCKRRRMGFQLLFILQSGATTILVTAPKL